MDVAAEGDFQAGGGAGAAPEVAMLYEWTRDVTRFVTSLLLRYPGAAAFVIRFRHQLWRAIKDYELWS